MTSRQAFDCLRTAGCPTTASLSSLLHFNRDFQDYLTRPRFNLHKMSLWYQFSFSSQAPIIWNDIPLTVLNSLTTTYFEKKLKLYFLRF